MRPLPLIRGKEDPNSFFVDSNYGPLLFDTGAASSQLLRSDLTRSLVQQEAVQSHGIFGEREQEQVTVDLLRVGDLTAENLTVTLDDTHGILGSDVLGDCAYTFDVENLAVTFIPHFSDGIPCKRNSVGHLIVPVEIGGTGAWALLDTGASASLIDTGFYQTVFGHAAQGKREEGKDFTGATMDTTMVPVNSLKIGKEVFPSHLFAALDLSAIFPPSLSIVAILGATTLSERKFSIDHKNGFLKLGFYSQA